MELRRVARGAEEVVKHPKQTSAGPPVIFGAIMVRGKVSEAEFKKQFNAFGFCTAYGKQSCLKRNVLIA